MDLNSQEIYASLWLNAINPLDPNLFRGLISQFGSASQAMDAGPVACGIAPFDFDDARTIADKEIQEWEKNKIRVYVAHAGPYPQILKEAGECSPVLFCQGEDIAPAP